MSAPQGPGIRLTLFIALSQFSSSLMQSILGVTLPTMGAELGASAVALSLSQMVFTGIAASLLLPIGRLADATDRNTLFKGALLGLGLTTFVIGTLPTIGAVIAARFFQGIAAAFLTATSMAIVADLAPRDRLGRMLGLAIGATYTGLASGPFFAGLVTGHLGWRWVFFLAALPPLASFALSQTMIESRWRAPTKPINVVNGALLVAAMLALIGGAATVGRSAYGFVAVAAGVGLGALFFLAEARSPDPLLRLGEIRANRALSQALTVQFLIYCGTTGSTFMLSLYLQSIRGLSPQAAGYILVIGPIGMALLAPLAGRLADRVSPRRLTVIGAALITCSVTLAAFIDAASGLSLIVAVMVFQGGGFALFSAPNIAAIMGSVPPQERGIASALTANMRTLGMVVSMFTVTTFLSLLLGGLAIPDAPAAYLATMSRSFTVFAVLSALGVLLALRDPGRGR